MIGRFRDGQSTDCEVSAHRVFFPLAMVLAAIVVPVWTALYQVRPDLAIWHAHEILFGYGLQLWPDSCWPG